MASLVSKRRHGWRVSVENLHPTVAIFRLELPVTYHAHTISTNIDQSAGFPSTELDIDLYFESLSLGLLHNGLETVYFI